MAIRYNDKWVYQINWNGGTDNVHTYKHDSSFAWKRPLECHFAISGNGATFSIYRKNSEEPLVLNKGYIDYFLVQNEESSYDFVPANNLSADEDTWAKLIFFQDQITAYVNLSTGYYLKSTSTLTNGLTIATASSSPITCTAYTDNKYAANFTINDTTNQTSGFTSTTTTANSGNPSGYLYAYNTSIYWYVSIPNNSAQGNVPKNPPTSGLTTVPTSSTTHNFYRTTNASTINPSSFTEGAVGASHAWTIDTEYRYKLSWTVTGKTDYTSYVSTSSTATSGSPSGTNWSYTSSSGGTKYIFIIPTGEWIPYLTGVGYGTLIAGTMGAPRAWYRFTVTANQVDQLVTFTAKNTSSVTIGSLLSPPTFKVVRVRDTEGLNDWNGSENSKTVYCVQGDEIDFTISVPITGSDISTRKPILVPDSWNEIEAEYDGYSVKSSTLMYVDFIGTVPPFDADFRTTEGEPKSTTPTLTKVIGYMDRAYSTSLEYIYAFLNADTFAKNIKYMNDFKIKYVVGTSTVTPSSTYTPGSSATGYVLINGTSTTINSSSGTKYIRTYWTGSDVIGTLSSSTVTSSPISFFNPTINQYIEYYSTGSYHAYINGLSTYSGSSRYLAFDIKSDAGDSIHSNSLYSDYFEGEYKSSMPTYPPLNILDAVQHYTSGKQIPNTTSQSFTIDDFELSSSYDWLGLETLIIYNTSYAQVAHVIRPRPVQS